MARVFISYRRKDGPYGVGWLAQALRSLDDVTGVDTEFHDLELRTGVKLTEALDREIDRSDVVVAMIGPVWRGEQPEGPARITDPSCWIVRELSAAYRLGKKVVPVLYAGAAHPLKSEVHESIQQISEQLAMPLHDERDMEALVATIRTYLVEIDDERAAREGLEEPIQIPRIGPPSLIAVAMAVLAIAGGVAGWLSMSYRACNPGQACIVQEAGSYQILQWIFPVVAAAAGPAALLGLLYCRRLLGLSRPRWLVIAALALFGGAAIVMLVFTSNTGLREFVGHPSLNHAGLRFSAWGLFGAVPATLWAFPIVSALYSSARGDRRNLANRAIRLSVMRETGRFAVLLHGVFFTLLVCIALLMLGALRQADSSVTYGPLAIIEFALVFGTMLSVGDMFVVSRLRSELAELDSHLDILPPRYRANARPQRQLDLLTNAGWWFRVVPAAPFVTALAGSVWLLLAS